MFGYDDTKGEDSLADANPYTSREAKEAQRMHTPSPGQEKRDRNGETWSEKFRRLNNR